MIAGHPSSNRFPVMLDAPLPVRTFGTGKVTEKSFWEKHPNTSNLLKDRPIFAVQNPFNVQKAPFNPMGRFCIPAFVHLKQYAGNNSLLLPSISETTWS
jgi:hypothetical protein